MLHADVVPRKERFPEYMLSFVNGIAMTHKSHAQNSRTPGRIAFYQEALFVKLISVISEGKCEQSKGGGQVNSFPA